MAAQQRGAPAPDSPTVASARRSPTNSTTSADANHQRRQPVVAFAHIDRRQRQVHLRARGQGNRHQTAVFSTVTNRRKAAPSIAAGTRSRQPFGSAISTIEPPASPAGEPGAATTGDEGDSAVTSR